MNFNILHLLNDLFFEVRDISLLEVKRLLEEIFVLDVYPESVLCLSEHLLVVLDEKVFLLLLFLEAALELTDLLLSILQLSPEPFYFLVLRLEQLLELVEFLQSLHELLVLVFQRLNLPVKLPLIV